MTTKESRVIARLEEEMMFPYAFMNTDANLIIPEMFCADHEKLEKQNKALAEISLLLEPDHESGLYNHFKQLYFRYLEALTMIDEDKS